MRPCLLLAAALLGACGNDNVKWRARSENRLPPPAVRPAVPPTRTEDVADVLHGERVADPYRWLEDVDSPETAAWVAAQNRATFGFLETIPARATLRRRLERLWDHERWSVPFREGDRWFWFVNRGLQDQPVLCVAPAPDAEPRVLLDPNALAPDGSVSISGVVPSPDGRLVAWGLSRAGSDWQEWRVRDVETGADRADLVRWIKFSSPAWTRDGRGFYYSRYDEPEPDAAREGVNWWNKLYHHALGTPQSEDRLVHERRDRKEWMFGAIVTEDGRWLVIPVHRGTDAKNQVLVLDLAAADGRVVELFGGFDHGWDLLGNDGAVFWFRTDRGAPRGRIVAVGLDRPEALREVVPEAAEAIAAASLVGGRLFVTYLKDARSLVRMFAPDGAARGEVELPGLGTVAGFAGRRGHAETCFSFTSPTTPSTIWRCEVATGQARVLRRPRVDFDPEAYETRQVFVTSRDGTRVPMFLSHRKGLARDGRNPTYLYGYGGFDVSLTPVFDVAALAWMELGGIHAVANLRGGGEYGEAWHRAGTRLVKQNTFDDFIACAEWLIAEGWTETPRLAIGGASNGGLTVGACLTQRPDLFGAALPAVGVLDLLRFHMFTIGWAWVDDYGSPDDPAEFRALRAYSPYHNLRPGTRYPATLVTTADHDDRVVPGHSFKFAARLQACQAGPAPVLIRIDVRAGHGVGKPITKVLETQADQWAFLVRALGME
jgi:prolyl oligopeptidase